jgi:PAS domain S-box-containing protein
VEPRWSADALFAGPGETRARLRATDWGSTPLGPVESWPVELRAAVRTVLPSRVPMLLWWGPDLVQIFNDSYMQMLGDKYPAAVGQPAGECWAEVWTELASLVDQARSGQATYSKNEQLFLNRHGYLEETYWTFSYSPIRDEDGGVAGIFVATTDVTARVLGDRRLETLRQLGGLSISVADTAADACRMAVEVLSRSRMDLPLVMAYLRRGIDDGGVPVPDLPVAADRDVPAGGDELTLVASSGVPPGWMVTPERFPGAGGLPEVLSVAETGRSEPVTGLAGRCPGITQVDTPWGRAAPDQALVLPLQVSGRPRPVGTLVLGINPHRELDASYRAFLDLVTARVSTMLTDAVAYQTERHRAAVLAELDAAKTLFFTNISHELRTPLALIAGPLEESLSEILHPLPSMHRELVEVAHHNTARLRRLVDNILDFVRIENGRLRAEPVPTDLAEFTRGIAESFGYAVRRAGLDFVVEVPRLPLVARVDRDMWEKIVVNLLSNAVKYTLAGRIRLSLDIADGEVAFAVTDTGVGIPPDEQLLLFQRFHRVHSSNGRSVEGAGIGLALVHELVRLHEGTVSVRSEVGRGSTFTVRLPAAVGQVTASTPRSRSLVPLYLRETEGWLPRSGLDGPVDAVCDKATVLVVDDNADMRAFLARLLQPHWTVTLAVDGQDALGQLDVAIPDLVLTDVMMPRLDGFGLVRKLRSDPRTATIPVIMLSARAGAESSAEGLDAGVDDYVVKPFSSVELVGRIRATLQLARLRSQESAWRSALIATMQDAFFVAGQDDTLVEVNDAYWRLVGASPSRLPLTAPFAWWSDPEEHPQERRQQEELWRQVVSDVGGGRATIPLRHLSGHRIWVEVVYSRLSDANGRGQLTVGTMRDITATVVAADRQQALNRLSGRLSAASDVAQVLTAGVDELHQLFGTDRVVAVLPDVQGAPEVVVGATALLARARHALAGVIDPGTVHQETTAEGLTAGVGTLVESTGPPALVWVGLTPARAVSPADLTQFRQLCGTVSRALRRARADEIQRAVALALQRAILGPQDLPEGFAVRYEPRWPPCRWAGTGTTWSGWVRTSSGWSSATAWVVGYPRPPSWGSCAVPSGPCCCRPGARPRRSAR